MPSIAFPPGAYPPGAYPAAAFPGPGAYVAPGASAFGPFPGSAFPYSAFPGAAFPGTAGTTAPGASAFGPFPPGAFPGSAFPPAAFPGSVLATPAALPAGLVEAAIAYLRANSAIASTFGWIGSDEAPPASPGTPFPSYPYLVLTEVSEAPDWDSGGLYTGRYQFQVAAVDVGKAAARAAARAIRAALDDAGPGLAFDGAEVLYLRRSGFVSAKDPERGPGGADVWRAVVTFSALTAESI